MLCDSLRSCGLPGTPSPMGDVHWSSRISRGKLFPLGDVPRSMMTSGIAVVTVTKGSVANGNLFPSGDVPWSTMTGGTVVFDVTPGVTADTRGGLDQSCPSTKGGGVC